MSDPDYVFDEDIHREGLDASNIQQLAPIEVASLKLRPLSAASRAALRHIENGFMTGLAADNPELSCITYAWIHSQPIDEVTAMVFGPRPKFLATALEWGQRFNSSQVDDLMDFVTAHMGASRKAETKPTKVKARSPKGSGQPRRLNT